VYYISTTKTTESSDLRYFNVGRASVDAGQHQRDQPLDRKVKMYIMRLAMIDKALTYRPADRALYLQGKLYSQWKRNSKYSQSTLFLEIDSEPHQQQFPVKCPPLKTQTYGFGELFAGMHYLEGGFSDVIRYHYYCHEGYDSYEKAAKVLGTPAAEFICRPHPQPPDLLVFDKKGRFFFVEVKLPKDRLNPNQTAFFRKIERYLNKNMPQSRRAPHLPEGQWIELLRLSPESANQ
jgi:hypothetical protein